MLFRSILISFQIKGAFSHSSSFIDFCLNSTMVRKHTLLFQYFTFVETCFMPQYLVYSVTCSKCTWNKCAFCSFWMACCICQFVSWVTLNLLYWLFFPPIHSFLSKSPAMIVNLPIPIFNSISFCFTYFEVVLSIYIFRAVISPCWITPDAII